MNDLVAGFGPVPASYPHMDPLNRAGAGVGAGIAASLLQRAGRAVVHLDDQWDRVGELDTRTIPAAA